MKGTFYADHLDWTSYGYSFIPILANDPELSMDPNSSAWIRLEEIVNRSKLGNFTELNQVIAMYYTSQLGWVLKRTCIEVLGDISTTSIFHRMMADLKGYFDPDKAIDFCSAFRAWGSLSAVPTIAFQYHKFKGFDDFKVVPLFLSSLLESEWGPISNAPGADDIDEYYDIVMMRYNELKKRFGTDQVIVFNGKLFGVIPLANLALTRLSDSPFDRTFQRFFRRRFEASTGINCTALFADGIFQGLKAAEMIERFLGSSEAARYEDGVRYFFGHRIPD
ncbi:MAG: hypothetical protein NPIRA01_08260 [Nitrospirales bacterium]|nr:MAG: hypothetical protein NPIRA01_08260 [Nitrospirales bacterium]